jgi:hypothetical protein
MPGLYGIDSNVTVNSSNTTGLYAIANTGNVITGNVSSTNTTGLYISQGNAAVVSNAQLLLGLLDNNGNVNFALDPLTQYQTVYAWFTGTGGGGSTYSNANVAAYLPIYSGALENSSSIINLWSNAAGQGASISQLYVDTYTLSQNITGANAAIASTNANVATTNANLAAFETYANTNFGTSSYANANVIAFLPTYTGSLEQSSSIINLWANAAAQQSNINIINANLGAFETYANLHFGTSTYSNANVAAYLPTYSGALEQSSSIINLWANAATQSIAIASINSNVIAANTNIQTLNANLGAFETYANLTFGTSNYGNSNVAVYLPTYTGSLEQSSSIINLWANAAGQAVALNTLNANVGAFETYANANLATQTTNFNTLNANVGAFETYANANLATQTTNFNTLNANVGAYEIWANANAATQATSINTLNANVGAYEIWANANLATQTTNFNTLNANVGAYEIWANATFISGNAQYGNANVAGYLPFYNGSIGSTLTQGVQPYVNSIGQSGLAPSVNGDGISLNAVSYIFATAPTSITGNLAYGPLLYVDGNTSSAGLTGTIVYTFTSNGSLTIPNNFIITSAKALVIGGGGGSYNGIIGSGAGGGGAGGVKANVSLANITAGQTYTITVGRGGYYNGSGANANGQPSSAFGITAVGGGAGGYSYGYDGGSGGGAGNTGYAAGLGTAGQGTNGGLGNNGAGGGGGGAGGAGGAATASNASGAGGAALFDNITGANVAYAYGGPGSWEYYPVPGGQTVINHWAAGYGVAGGTSPSWPIPLPRGSGAPGGVWTADYQAGQDGVVILQLNYTSSTYGGITTPGVVRAGNLVTTNGIFWANGSNLISSIAYGNANVAAYLPTYSGSLGGTLTTASQTAITAVGTLGSMTVTGNASAGNISTAGTLTAGTFNTTGAVAAGNLITTNGLFWSNGVAYTTGSYGNTQVAQYLPNYNGNINATVTQFSQPYITRLGTVGNTAPYYYAYTPTSTTHIFAPANITISALDDGGAPNKVTVSNTAITLATTGLSGINISTTGSLNLTGTSAVDIYNTPSLHGNTTIIQYGGVGATDYLITPNLKVTTGAYFSAINATGAATVGNVITTNGVFWSNGISYSASTSYGNTQVAAYLTTYSGNLGGTLTTASQTNITALGTLGALSVTGNISTGNIGGTKGTFFYVTGTLLTSAQPNVTSLGTLSALAVTGAATMGNVVTTNGVFWSNGVAYSSGATYGNTDVANYLPTYSGSLGGTLTTASQTAITAVGTLGSLAVTGNVTTGNVSGTKGTFTNVQGTLLTAAQTNITAVGTLTALSVTGNVNAGNVIATKGEFTSVQGTLITAAQTNITSVGTLSAVSVTGAATVGNVITTNGVFWSNGTAYSSGGGTYGNTQVAAYLPTYTGNIGNVQFTGYRETVYSLGTSVTGTISVDYNNGTVQTATLTGNVILNTNNIANMTTGSSLTLILTQDATGSRLLTSNLKYAANNRTLSTAANSIDSMTIFYTGTNYLASLVKGYL